MMTDEEKNRKLSDLVDIINKNYEDVDLLNALGKGDFLTGTGSSL